MVLGGHHTLTALPQGRTQYALYGRLGEPQGQFGWMQKILPTTVIQSADHPAHSELLYRLSCPSPHSEAT